MTNGVLDFEWVSLMNEAKDLGLTIEEVRDFFENYQKKENKTNGVWRKTV